MKMKYLSPYFRKYHLCKQNNFLPFGTAKPEAIPQTVKFTETRQTSMKKNE